MSKNELIKEYIEDIEYLRKCAKDLKLSDKEIDQVFHSCFKIIKKRANISNNAKYPKQKILKWLLGIIIFTVIIVIIYVILNVHRPTSSIILRNVQSFIYPGLKFIRFLSVPIIKKVPSLTYLYDESCLLENPFFYVHDIACWPCENVFSVINLTGFNNHSLYPSGMPYIVKTDQNLVTFETIKELYINNSNILDNNANSLKSTNNKISDLKDLFSFSPDSESHDTHILWRIKRLIPGRIIRSVFPRPYFVSKWAGQSVERYLIIDESKAQPYALPNTECSYVFVIQGSGERTIILKPSRECINDCRTVYVTLKASHVLWYNWWYWRPLSLPAENSTETSITYINSYC